MGAMLLTIVVVAVAVWAAQKRTPLADGLVLLSTFCYRLALWLAERADAMLDPEPGPSNETLLSQARTIRPATQTVAMVAGERVISCTLWLN